MGTEVTQCADCPFFSPDFGTCDHDTAASKSVYGRGKIPDWCPLRKGPILIKLKDPT